MYGDGTLLAGGGVRGPLATTTDYCVTRALFSQMNCTSAVPLLYYDVALADFPAVYGVAANEPVTGPTDLGVATNWSHLVSGAPLLATFAAAQIASGRYWVGSVGHNCNQWQYDSGCDFNAATGSGGVPKLIHIDTGGCAASKAVVCVGIGCGPVASQAPTTLGPTTVPTLLPTRRPTLVPTDQPTRIPTIAPTRLPTRLPTTVPSASPTTSLPEIIMYQGPQAVSGAFAGGTVDDRVYGAVQCSGLARSLCPANPIPMLFVATTSVSPPTTATVSISDRVNAMGGFSAAQALIGTTSAVISSRLSNAFTSPFITQISSASPDVTGRYWCGSSAPGNKCLNGTSPWQSVSPANGSTCDSDSAGPVYGPGSDNRTCSSVLNTACICWPDLVPRVVPQNPSILYFNFNGGTSIPVAPIQVLLDMTTIASYGPTPAYLETSNTIKFPVAGDYIVSFSVRCLTVFTCGVTISGTNAVTSKTDFVTNIQTMNVKVLVRAQADGVINIGMQSDFATTLTADTTQLRGYVMLDSSPSLVQYTWGSAQQTSGTTTSVPLKWSTVYSKGVEYVHLSQNNANNIYALVDGYYEHMFSSYVYHVSGSPSLYNCYMDVYKNGVFLYAAYTTLQASGTVYSPMTTVIRLNMTAGDYVHYEIRSTVSGYTCGIDPPSLVVRMIYVDSMTSFEVTGTASDPANIVPPVSTIAWDSSSPVYNVSTRNITFPRTGIYLYDMCSMTNTASNTIYYVLRENGVAVSGNQIGITGDNGVLCASHVVAATSSTVLSITSLLTGIGFATFYNDKDAGSYIMRVGDLPTPAPTLFPTLFPTTLQPTLQPTGLPTLQPTRLPTEQPTTRAPTTPTTLAPTSPPVEPSDARTLSIFMSSNRVVNSSGVFLPYSVQETLGTAPAIISGLTSIVMQANGLHVLYLSVRFFAPPASRCINFELIRGGTVVRTVSLPTLTTIMPVYMYYYATDGLAGDTYQYQAISCDANTVTVANNANAVSYVQQANDYNAAAFYLVASQTFSNAALQLTGETYTTYSPAVINGALGRMTVQVDGIYEITVTANVIVSGTCILQLRNSSNAVLSDSVQTVVNTMTTMVNYVGSFLAGDYVTVYGVSGGCDLTAGSLAGFGSIRRLAEDRVQTYNGLGNMTTGVSPFTYVNLQFASTASIGLSGVIEAKINGNVTLLQPGTYQYSQCVSFDKGTGSSTDYRGFTMSPTPAAITSSNQVGIDRLCAQGFQRVLVGNNGFSQTRTSFATPVPTTYPTPYTHFGYMKRLSP